MNIKGEDTKSPKISIKTESQMWTKDETNTLLNRMLANLSKSDTQKYTSMLEKINWEKISFGSFSANECKEKWGLVSKEVRKYRTLTELLNDAKEYLKDPYKGQVKKHPDYPKRPLTPYFRFFMEKRDAFAAKHKDMTNLQVTAELSKKYRALPAKKKERYVTEWKKATEQFQIAMKKFKDEHPEYFSSRPSKPVEPRTPGIIFRDESYDEYARKHPKMSKKEVYEGLRKKYKTLTDEKRQQYIEKALKEQQEHKIALDKFLLSNPDVQKKEKVILNKYERKLNDKKMGKPEKPPSNGYNLFCTEMMPQLKSMMSQQRIVECGKLWNLKSNEEKQEYQDRYIKMKHEYETNIDKYNQKLSPEEREKENVGATKGRRQRQNPGRSIKSEIKEELSSEESDSDDDVPLQDSSEEVESEEEEEENEEDSEEEEKEEEQNDQNDLASSASAPARPTTPISALFLYQKANRKKIESQYPTMSSDEITRLLARRYHELPEHKRHKYLQKEKEQRAIYNEKMQEYLKKGNTKNGVESAPIQLQPVTGEQLYHEKHNAAYCKKFKNDKKQVEAALRVAWSKLSKARKEPFIKQAHEINQKNITAYNEALQNQSAAKAENQKRKAAGSTHSTSAAPKKLKLEGVPKKPPADGFQLFSSTKINKLSHLSESEKHKEISRLWKNLDESKKTTHTNEAKRLNAKYQKDIAVWLKSQPKETAEQFLAQQAKKRSKKDVGNVSPSKKMKVETPTAFMMQSKEESDESSNEDSDDSDSSSSDESDDGEEDSSSDSSDSDSDECSSDSSDDDEEDDDSSSSQSE